MSTRGSILLLLRLSVWMYLVLTLSCSGGQGSNLNDEGTQPTPIWSSAVKITDWSPDAFYPAAIKVASERVYVAGGTTDSGGAEFYAWATAFSTNTGSIVSEFGDAGKEVYTDIGGTVGLELDNESLFLLGHSWTIHVEIGSPYLPGAGIMQERDALDGSLILTTICGATSGNLYAQGMSVGGDSAFLLFHDSSTSTSRIERRLLGDGTLVESFGMGGVITTGPSSAGRVALYDNKIFILRIFDVEGEPLSWELEKRSAETGQLDVSFGVGGIVVSQVAEAGYPVGLAVDATGVYVLVGDYQYDYWDQPHPSNRFVLSKRSLDDGLLVGAFGDKGMISSTVDGVAPTALALHDGALFVATTHRLASSDTEWRIEAFKSFDGKRFSGFGLNGVMSRNITDGNDIPSAITADSAGVYVAGQIFILSSEILVEKYSRGD